MYPSRFGYESPKTVEEAVALLDAHGGEAKVLAGGQSLVPMMRLRFAAPEMIIDINGILSFFDLDVRKPDATGKMVVGEHLSYERKVIIRLSELSYILYA
jgi:carbon-monoxide dehydrogenase medium subunit